jgi:hypothetical protein
MADIAPQVTAKPTPAVHRLGVIHFLLWMLGCAAAVTGYRVFTNWELVAAEDVLFIRMMHLGMGMAYGVGVVTFYVLWCSWRRRDGAFPAHPGHWMLLLGLAAALLDGAATLLVRGAVKLAWIAPWEEWYIIQVLGFAAGSFVIVVFLCRARVEWRWRAIWMMILVLTASRSALWLLFWLNYRVGWPPGISYTLPANVEAACMAAGAVALVGAIWCDAARKIRRDWLHWTGIAVWLAMAAVELAVCFHIFWFPGGL